VLALPLLAMLGLLLARRALLHGQQ
jgi:hypothetical protein